MNLKMNEIANKIKDFKDKTLLIVDDDHPFRDRLARSMEKKGFVVSQAEGIKSGVQKAKEIRPEFAVIDLRLTDGNGLEVVKAVQETRRESRIVMLTGYGNIPTAVAAIKEGAIDYLSKPADADDIEKALLAASNKSEKTYFELHNVTDKEWDKFRNSEADNSFFVWQWISATLMAS